MEIAEQTKHDEPLMLDWSPVKAGLHTEFASLAEEIKRSNDNLSTMFKAAIDGKPASVAVVSSDDEAHLAESMTGSVKKAGGRVIPVVVGGFGAIILTETIDGVALKMNKSKMVTGIAKSITAFAVWKYGKKIPYMGETGKNIAAALVAFDALRDLTPIGTWGSQIANKLTGVIPVGGLADQRGRDVIMQARVVANNKGVGI